MNATQATIQGPEVPVAQGRLPWVKTIATIRTEEGVPTLKLRLKPEPSLKDLCFEQIKDSFYYGVYGDTSSPNTCFRLIIDQNTGYFNATKLCQAGGKRFKDWFKSKRTKDLIDCVEEELDRGPIWGRGPEPTFEVNGGNKDNEGATISGTYVCKELIVDIASWISPAFGLKCARIVNNMLISQNASMDQEERDTMMKLLKEKDDKIEGLEEQVQEKDDKIERMERMLQEMRLEQRKTLGRMENKLVEANDKMEEVTEKIDDLKDDNRLLQKRLNIAVVDRAPQPDKSIKKERFVMMKRSDEEYPYYVVRGQTAYTASVIRSQKKEHKDVIILVDFNHHPNSKTYYNRVKDQLRSQGVEAVGNAIRIDNCDVTEKDLVAALESINEEKRNV